MSSMEVPTGGTGGAASSSSASQEIEESNLLYKEEYKPWFLPLMIFAFPILPFVWNYHVTITEDELDFGYSSVYMSKRVTNRKVTIQSVTPLFDQKWSGWGIHYRPDPTHSVLGYWERLYICNNGGAVKMVLRTNDSVNHGETEETVGSENTTITFYFSTNDPQKVCDILNKRV